jgi:hypothetical protein
MSDILMFDVATFDICILHSKCTWFTIMLQYGPECNIIITKRKLIKKSTICNMQSLLIAWQIKRNNIGPLPLAAGRNEGGHYF